MKFALSSTVGLILIAISLALLLFSFSEAYNSYRNYSSILPQPGASDLSQAVTSVSFQLINLAIKIAFLGVMVWISGLILKYGIEALKIRPSSFEEQKPKA